jgi:hypothetical protein
VRTGYYAVATSYYVMGTRNKGGACDILCRAHEFLSRAH